MTTEQTKCADIIRKEWRCRAADLQALLTPDTLHRRALKKRLDALGANTYGINDVNELGEIARDLFADYGLAFDYVAPGTFTDQRTGYWRYQMSYGGPSDELRFYGAHTDRQPARIEYWFLDWFDGASIDVSGTVAGDVWEFFHDIGSVRAEFERATDEE